MGRTSMLFVGSVFILLAGLSTAAAAPAHHGRGATYDASELVTVEGTVSEWAWRNPHVVLYVDVTDSDGNVANWAFESQNVSSLARLGMSRRSFVVGQKISVRFNPSRGGAPIGVIRRVYDSTGKEVLAFGGPINE